MQSKIILPTNVHSSTITSYTFLKFQSNFYRIIYHVSLTFCEISHKTVLITMKHMQSKPTISSFSGPIKNGLLGGVYVKCK